MTKEITLKSDFKFNSYRKIKTIIKKTNPDIILVNTKQYDDYFFMLKGEFPKDRNTILTIFGIKLKVYF